MVEILCVCGHSIEAHKKNGCKAVSSKDEKDWSCDCLLSKEAVQARYWAKKYRQTSIDWEKAYEEKKKEYDKLVSRWNDTHVEIYDERNTLQTEVESLGSQLGNAGLELMQLSWKLAIAMLALEIIAVSTSWVEDNAIAKGAIIKIKGEN